MSSNFLNLAEDREPAPSVSALPPSYLEAVNAARFIKGFGLIALIYSLLLFFGVSLMGAGIGVGTGLFILRYDNKKFYRILGIVTIVLAILLPLAFLSPLVLSGTILWRGITTLKILKYEGQTDDDWAVSKKRALIGTICSGFGVFFSCNYILLLVLSLVLNTIQR